MILRIKSCLVVSKFDCKGVNFNPLRGVAPQEEGAACDCELLFAELNTSCKYIKMTDVRTHFMRYVLGSKQKKCKEKLEPFMELEGCNSAWHSTEREMDGQCILDPLLIG